MTYQEYIATARKLVSAQPTAVDIRRAVSTAYYAMFHHVSHSLFALVTAHTVAQPLNQWTSIYRTPEHQPLTRPCIEAAAGSWGFSVAIKTYATSFVTAYKERIDADYDPARTFTVADATAVINSVEGAIIGFDQIPGEHQRAFILFISLRPRTA